MGIDRITSPPDANYSYSVQAGVSAGIDMVNIHVTLHETEERKGKYIYIYIMLFETEILTL